MSRLKIIFNVFLLIFLYYISYYLYLGLLNPIVSLGDSWDYHIPIALTILDGSFLSHIPSLLPGWYFPDSQQVLTRLPQWYYPGSAEAINSLFLLLGIPLTLTNILATIILFFACWKLALVFKLENNYALIFALTFTTLTAVVRWLNNLNVDIWVGVFLQFHWYCWKIPKRAFCTL